MADILMKGTEYAIVYCAQRIRHMYNLKYFYKAFKDILTSFKIIVMLQRELHTFSGEAGDEGSNALMSDYIRIQEKSIWMYSAFFNRKIKNRIIRLTYHWNCE